MGVVCKKRAGLNVLFGRGFLLVEQRHDFRKSLGVAFWIHP